jgi:hypothetical protein
VELYCCFSIWDQRGRSHFICADITCRCDHLCSINKWPCPLMSQHTDLQQTACAPIGSSNKPDQLCSTGRRHGVWFSHHSGAGHRRRVLHAAAGGPLLRRAVVAVGHGRERQGARLPPGAGPRGDVPAGVLRRVRQGLLLFRQPLQLPAAVHAYATHRPLRRHLRRRPGRLLDVGVLLVQEGRRRRCWFFRRGGTRFPSDMRDVQRVL